MLLDTPTVSAARTASAALQTSINDRPGRAGHPKQPTSCIDLFDKVDDAHRPWLLAQDIDGVLDALLLLGRQPRSQRLPSSSTAGDGRGFVDFAQARTVAINRGPVNPKSLGQSEPDDLAKTLTIKIHRMANPSHDKAVAALLNDLTLAGFCHPETGAKMVYALV